MIICCKKCGNCFKSDSENVTCDYCSGNTEVLLSDSDILSANEDDIENMIIALKERFKTEDNPDYDADLWKLQEEKSSIISLKNEKKELYNKYINHMTTTGLIFEGYIITQYHKVISGNVVLGTGLFSEWVASLDDILGTTSSPFENKMKKAKEIALDKLIRESSVIGGNAIIGIDFDFLTIGNNMIAVSANGTSVTVEKTNNQL